MQLSLTYGLISGFLVKKEEGFIGKCYYWRITGFYNWDKLIFDQ